MKYDPPKLVVEKDDGNSIYREWVLEEKETDDFVIYVYRWDRLYPSDGTTCGGKKRSKIQKFLAVNGPNAGTKLSSVRAHELGYVPYNCAVNAHTTKGWPRTVYIHPIGRAENFLFKIIDKP